MSEQELRELCERVVKRGRTYADEKKVIEAECEARGIALNKKCSNCYTDAAAVIYSQLPKPEIEQEETEHKWILRPGIDVLFGGIRICAATITDELAENVVARGFSKMFFAIYPSEK